MKDSKETESKVHKPKEARPATPLMDAQPMRRVPPVLTGQVRAKAAPKAVVETMVEKAVDKAAPKRAEPKREQPAPVKPEMTEQMRAMLLRYDPLNLLGTVSGNHSGQSQEDDPDGSR